ncbi:hypothetical protein [Moorena sp. SIO3B2]|uniref:hypothetical protein n=1 Tax=Moorena sp. SIO3B2 TaxID=2607827 RepID=UPI0013CD039C|nr:hypothetical protein [Moorena sp. SIO3B2]NEP35736.1 hypothetical protein [Moorena sp. SIO3B2]
MQGVRKTIAAMQRGLGGFPHERLHQDIVAISKRVVKVLRVVKVKGVKKTVAAMQRGLGGFPHERLHQDIVAISKRVVRILRVVSTKGVQKNCCTDTLNWSAAHKIAIAFLRTSMRSLF